MRQYNKGKVRKKGMSLKAEITFGERRLHSTQKRTKYSHEIFTALDKRKRLKNEPSV